jgi:Sap, sulfolipid-1-addressing protein
VLSWIEIVAGVALGVWVLARRGRPRAAEPAEPRWMGRVDGMPPVLAFVLGAFLPNYVIVVAAVDQMLQNDLRSGWLLLAVVAFVLLASIGVAAPLAVLVVRRDQAPEVYERWRVWLMAHSSAAGLAVVGLVAVFLLAKGVVGLLT